MRRGQSWGQKLIASCSTPNKYSILYLSFYSPRLHHSKNLLPNVVQWRPESLQHEEVPAFLVSFGVKNIPLSSKTKTTAKPLLPPELSYSVFHDCPFCWMPDQRLIQPLRRQAGIQLHPGLSSRCDKGTFLSLSGNTPSYPKRTDRESITPKMFERGGIGSPGKGGEHFL